MQANDADSYTVYGYDFIWLIPKQSFCSFQKNISIYNGESCFLQLSKSIFPTIIKFVIADGGCINIHIIHQINDGFSIGERRNVWSAKVISGIKIKGVGIGCFFFFYQCGNVCKSTQQTGMTYPGYFERFYVGVKIIGIKNGYSFFI